jgi:hypothetical protein
VNTRNGKYSVSRLKIRVRPRVRPHYPGRPQFIVSRSYNVRGILIGLAEVVAEMHFPEPLKRSYCRYFWVFRYRGGLRIPFRDCDPRGHRYLLQRRDAIRYPYDVKTSVFTVLFSESFCSVLLAW